MLLSYSCKKQQKTKSDFQDRVTIKKTDIPILNADTAKSRASREMSTFSSQWLIEQVEESVRIW